MFQSAGVFLIVLSPMARDNIIGKGGVNNPSAAAIGARCSGAPSGQRQPFVVVVLSHLGWQMNHVSIHSPKKIKSH